MTIKLFASGHSVERSIEEGEIKPEDFIVTTNYPLTLIDKSLKSAMHIVSDIDTAENAKDSIDCPVIIREVTYAKVEVYPAIVYSTKRLAGCTSFQWGLQLMARWYPEATIEVYGLDFCLPVNEKYARWYDKYLPVEKRCYAADYRSRMLEKERDQFYADFVAHYKPLKNSTYRKVVFKGDWRP